MLYMLPLVSILPELLRSDLGILGITGGQYFRERGFRGLKSEAKGSEVRYPRAERQLQNDL